MEREFNIGDIINLEWNGSIIQVTVLKITKDVLTVI